MAKLVRFGVGYDDSDRENAALSLQKSFRGFAIRRRIMVWLCTSACLSVPPFVHRPQRRFNLRPVGGKHVRKYQNTKLPLKNGSSSTQTPKGSGLRGNIGCTGAVVSCLIRGEWSVEDSIDRLELEMKMLEANGLHRACTARSSYLWCRCSLLLHVYDQTSDSRRDQSAGCCAHPGTQFDSVSDSENLENETAATPNAAVTEIRDLCDTWGGYRHTVCTKHLTAPFARSWSKRWSKYSDTYDLAEQDGLPQSTHQLLART